MTFTDSAKITIKNDISIKQIQKLEENIAGLRKLADDSTKHITEIIFDTSEDRDCVNVIDGLLRAYYKVGDMDKRVLLREKGSFQSLSRFVVKSINDAIEVDKEMEDKRKRNQLTEKL